MKNFEYDVLFEGDMKETVFAACYTDAVILACANRINKGFHLRALKVILNETGEFQLIHPKVSVIVAYR